MLAEVTLVREDVLDQPVLAVIVRDGKDTAVLVAVHGIEALIVLRKARADGVARVEAVGQALDGERHVEIVVGREVLAYVVADLVERAQRVVRVVVVFPGKEADRTILVVRDAQRVHEVGAAEVHVAAAAVEIAVARAGAVFHPFAEILVEVDVERVALELVADGDTLVVRHVARQVEAGALARAADRDVVLHLVAIAQGQVEPVRALAGGVHRLFCGGRGPAGFGLALVEGLRIHHFRDVDGLVERPVAVVGNDHLVARLAFLGLDQDDAIGAAGAVDGGRRSILQDLDRLDVVGIDLRPGPVERNAVEDDQRLVGSRDGVVAADARHGVGSFRVGTGHGNVQAGHGTLQRLDEVGRRALFQLLGTERGHRTGHVAFFLGTVTHDHGLFEHVHVFLEDNVDRTEVLDRVFLRHISDKGELQDVADLGRDRESTVSLRIGTDGSALDQHADAEERLTRGTVNDSTLDLSHRRQQDQRQDEGA